ncbi:MAG TPA: hypothetical protein VJ933_02580 [Phaeodactylibacter sp.]|nr:hypothetical protein [Phaeodactylibacter sp.]
MKTGQINTIDAFEAERLEETHLKHIKGGGESSADIVIIDSIDT